MLSGVTGRIDVHCHLLPGIDDGCQTLADSLACAKVMVDNGYTHSFCTPHIWPNLPENRQATIAARVASLQAELDQRRIPLRLIPGGEMNMTDATPNLAKEAAITYGGKGTHLLIDLWADRLPAFFEPSVKRLQSFGLKVILAHPERMRAIQDDPGLIDRIAEMGVLLQCNLQCLGDPPHSMTRLVSEHFLKADRYFMLGSDLHNPASLPVRMHGLKRAIDLIGEAKVWELTRENPKKLVS